jgi:hypothetical protein
MMYVVFKYSSLRFASVTLKVIYVSTVLVIAIIRMIEVLRSDTNIYYTLRVDIRVIKP